MNKMPELVRQMQSAVDRQADKAKPTAFDTTAVVTRVEGNTAWVHFDGGADETPVELTIATKPGDTVKVRVSGGNAWLQGNSTAPPTDDSRANESYVLAEMADGAAKNALENAKVARDAAESAQAHAAEAEQAAEDAQGAADIAQKDADTAQNAADGAILGLSEVQKIVGTLNWASENAEYQLTTDLQPIPGKTYWTRSGTGPEYTYSAVSYLDVVVYELSGDTQVESGKTYYELTDEGEYVAVVPSGTENPSEEGWYEFVLGTYYEIANVDETMMDYIISHLALTDDGLLIFRDNESGKLLLNEDGVALLDGNNNSIATYGEGTVIGDPSGVHIEIKSNPAMGFNDPIIGFYMADSSLSAPVSYINGSGLSIPHAVIVTSLQIGDENSGAWKWVVGDEQDITAARHLKLIWVGGN